MNPPLQAAAGKDSRSDSLITQRKDFNVKNSKGITASVLALLGKKLSKIHA